jgi:diaminopimelate epimerase
MRLTKHHGLGNDFLVLVDLDGNRPVTTDEVVALCDRRTGVGADGFIRVTRSPGGDADVDMQLLNADGSPAEMSGNGIRCLAQAVFGSGLFDPPRLRVRTDAGLRTVTAVEEVSPREHRITVDMGEAKVGDDEPEWVEGAILRAARVDLGNPHLVLHTAPDGPDVAEIGERVNDLTPGGVNVELIRPGAAPGLLEMTVYERGVGVTLACGTGACAAAAAAHAWELATDRSTVRMPGGDVEVQLGDSVLLTGPAVSVAALEVPWP